MNDIKKEELLINTSKEMEHYDLIKRSNGLIKTITLKQKEYAPVNERVMAYRRVHPLGQIITTKEFTENYVIFEAKITDEDGMVLATGHAREYLKTEFALEKAETSAIGRAIGMCGYGISTSLASFEDMEDVGESKIFDEPTPEEILKDLHLTKQEEVDFLNCIHKVDIKSVPGYLLSALKRFKDEQKHNSQ